MAEALKTPEPSLYDTDFHAWTRDQAAKLRARAHSALDWARMAEEIDGLGDSHRDEIESRLAVLLQHLLKWHFQPDRRSKSWLATIFQQRMRIMRRLRRSPSLKSYPSEVLAEEYEIARLQASGETGLPLVAFPLNAPIPSQRFSTVTSSRKRKCDILG